MDTEEPIEDILLWFFEFKMLYFWPKMIVFVIEIRTFICENLVFEEKSAKNFQKCEFS